MRHILYDKYEASKSSVNIKRCDKYIINYMPVRMIVLIGNRNNALWSISRNRGFQSRWTLRAATLA